MSVGDWSTKTDERKRRPPAAPAADPAADIWSTGTGQAVVVGLPQPPNIQVSASSGALAFASKTPPDASVSLQKVGAPATGSLVSVGPAADRSLETPRAAALVRSLAMLPSQTVYRLAELVFGEELGAGSFGSVSLARHTPTQSDVVVKRIQTNSLNQLTAARREAQILQYLKPSCDPYLLCYEGFVQDEKGQNAYLITQRAQDMTTLKLAINTPGWPPNDFAAAHIIRNLLIGLKLIHSKGVAHRDVKPDNILVGRTAANATSIRYIDFGLACLGDRCHTDTKSGSPAFMAPELGLGAHGVFTLGQMQATDMWSLGATIWEIITSKHLAAAWAHARGIPQEKDPITFWRNFDYESKLDPLYDNNQVVETALAMASEAAHFSPPLSLKSLLKRNYAERRIIVPQIQMAPIEQKGPQSAPMPPTIRSPIVTDQGFFGWVQSLAQPPQPLPPAAAPTVLPPVSRSI